MYIMYSIYHITSHTRNNSFPFAPSEDNAGHAGLIMFAIVNGIMGDITKSF